MRINNNFNVLPFYDSLQKQNSKKWYSFGQHYPLICPNNKLLPFQFVTNEELTITGNIVAVNVTTGQTTDLGVKPGVMLGTQPGAQYYIVKLSETAINKSLEGLHYLQINTNKGYIYSEEFVFTDSYSECVRLEYWNEDTLNFTSGEINFDDDFKFVMYISSTIGKPEYEFEEELTKRLGYKFIESQTSNKIYKFNFLAPEYICDAMRLVRMCDYIKLTIKYDTYNALSFSYEPKWQNNGDLAAVDVEFDTDCIIQKLESFNRRLKESFYNALLADIDEPVLFSTDTVAQYYTEFTTTSYINGKLIRQLEAISEDDLSQSINDIVLPIDNQSDTNQVAKKVFLSNIINKFAPQVDLSKYLLKSVWDSVFELRDDIETGKKYIYGKLPVVLQYGLTMYSGDGVDIPSIYEGLPIDNDTIYWKNGILKAKAGTEGAITEITSSMVTSALGYTPYDASNPNGYITRAALSNYALSSDVEAVSTKLNDFLEGSDTDNIINKWKELETFLSGLSQSDNLATILGNKAEKTDLAKYIPIAGATDITGEKNFIGGLKINGSPIYYDTEKKYWKLEGDLLVTGGVTMYGNEGTFTPSTIMDAILYDKSTLGINANGELYVKGGTGGVSGDYLPLTGGQLSGTLVVGRADSGNYTEIRHERDYTNTFLTSLLGTSIFGNNYNGVSTYLNINSDFGLFYTSSKDNHTAKYPLLHSNNYASYALPLSGGTINSGTKAPSVVFKSTHTSETTIQFSRSDTIKAGVGYNDLYGAFLWNATNSNTLHLTDDGTIKLNRTHTIWHSGNFTPSNYLPLSGGTITNNSAVPLTINANNDGQVGLFLQSKGNNKTYVGWDNSRGTCLYEFASDSSLNILNGVPRFNTNTLWHSGNDGSGSGLDADLLDGYDSSYIMKYGGNWTASTDTAGIFAFGFGGSSAGLANNYGAGIQLCNAQGINSKPSLNNNDSNWYSQLLFGTDNRVYARFNTNGGGWSGQNKIAYVTDNVASATKLATSRTIWGQSFDGTGNVDGALSTAHNNFFISADGGNTQLLGYSKNDKYYSLGYSAGVNGIPTHLYGGEVRLYSGTSETVRVINGRVGVGITNPSAKLHVNGDITTGGGYLQSWRDCNNSTGGYLRLVGYYSPTQESWVGIIASDYYGQQWCTVGGYTHGMVFKSGRSGFDNFIFLDTSANPIARICSSSFGSIIFKNNVLTDGGITMYSDIRKKTKLKDVVLSLQQVANAPLIEHYYNSDPNKTTHVGSIAQYWAEMNDWFCKKDSEGYYTMEIQNAALASAISIARELVKFETETDRRIRLLEEENKRLKEEVEYLKLNVA